MKNQKESMMRTKCPECGGIFSVPEYAIGTSIKCGKCSSSFIAGIYDPAIKRKRILAMLAMPAMPTATDAATPDFLVSGIAIASLALGVVACVTCWIDLLAVVSLPVSILGVVFGVLALVTALAGKRTDPGLAGSGIFVSLVALAIVIFSIDYQQYQYERLEDALHAIDDVSLIDDPGCQESRLRGTITISDDVLSVTNGNSFAWFGVAFVVNGEYSFSLSMLPGRETANIAVHKFKNEQREKLVLSDYDDVDMQVRTDRGYFYIR